MLWAIALILFLLWLVGAFGFAAAVGNFVHILLLLAVAVAVIRIIQGRKPL